MKKEKLKLEYIFYILMAILIGLFLYWLFHDDKGTQWNVFFRKTSDYFADYINVLRYSAWHDPYFNALNGPSEKGYFPLTYLIFYWLAKAVNFAEYRDVDDKSDDRKQSHDIDDPDHVYPVVPDEKRKTGNKVADDTGTGIFRDRTVFL